MDEVMRSLRGTDRVELGGLFGRWDEAVGEAVGAHLRPIKLDRGVLLVEADDPAWATQVRFLAGTIIERLEEVAGVTVQSVEVRVTNPR
jgi:predicted nucleic acid-binding Zn ribbon protein